MYNKYIKSFLSEFVRNQETRYMSIVYNGVNQNELERTLAQQIHVYQITKHGDEVVDYGDDGMASPVTPGAAGGEECGDDKEQEKGHDPEKDKNDDDEYN